MSAGRRERDNPRVGQQPSRVVAAPRRDNRRTNLDTGRMVRLRVLINIVSRPLITCNNHAVINSSTVSGNPSVVIMLSIIIIEFFF